MECRRKLNLSQKFVMLLPDAELEKRDGHIDILLKESETLWMLILTGTCAEIEGDEQIQVLFSSCWSYWVLRWYHDLGQLGDDATGDKSPKWLFWTIVVKQIAATYLEVWFQE